MIKFYNYSYDNYNCSYYNWSYYTIVIFILMIISSSATNSSPPSSHSSSSSSTPPPAPSLLTNPTSANLKSYQSTSNTIPNLNDFDLDNRSNNINININNKHNIINNKINHSNNYLNYSHDVVSINKENSTSSSNPEGSSEIQFEKAYSRANPKVCSTIQIRNNLQSFEQLRNCNIIDGSLTIALVSKQPHPYKPEDYENLRFPHLYEITEYLIFFRVEGISTLSKLFPNLAVIRGKELVSNHAFIIYQLFNLQEIALPKLNDILRGSVRIENNPNLCYVTSVNWDHICKHTFVPHFIKGNNNRCNNKCPKNCRAWTLKLNNNGDFSSRYVGDVSRVGAREDNGTVTFCWNNKECQESCQENNSNADLMFPLRRDSLGCCSAHCAGGCYEPRKSEQCLACRSVIQEDKCVEQCASHLFEYRGRCIQEQDCLRTIAHVQSSDPCSKTTSDQNLITNLKAIRLPGEKHGRCRPDCPPGFEEDPTIKSKCKACDKGKCRKGK